MKFIEMLQTMSQHEKVFEIIKESCPSHPEEICWDFRIKGSCEFINNQPILRADQITDESNITREMSVHKLT